MGYKGRYEVLADAGDTVPSRSLYTFGIAARAGANEYAYALPSDSVMPQRRVCHGLQSTFSKQSHERVDIGGILYCHSEELRMNILDIVKESPPAANCSSGFLTWRIETRSVPPRCRNGSDTINAIQKVLPEYILVRRTREAAGHTDYCHLERRGTYRGVRNGRPSSLR